MQLEDVTSLHAVNAKKEASRVITTNGRLARGVPSGFEISIADFLEGVKEHFSDVLSADVIKKLGIERKPTEITGNLRFSMRENDQSLALRDDALVEAAKETRKPRVEITVEKAGENRKFSIRELPDGNKHVEVDTDQDIFDGVKPEEYAQILKKYMKRRFQGQVIGRKNRAFVNGNSIREYTHPAKIIDEATYQDKMKAGTEIDLMMEAAEFIEHNEDDGRHADAIRGWDHYRIIYEINHRVYEGQINVKKTARGDLFHDLTQIRDITNAFRAQYGKPQVPAKGNVSMNNIPQNAEENNPSAQFSLREYSEHQKENWKNSKLINIYESDEQLLAFIERALKDRSYKGKMYFGQIGSELAQAIYNETGVETEGLNLALYSDEVEKIIKDHGDEMSEALRDQRAIITDDFRKIVDIVTSPDTIRRSEQDYFGKPVIVFTKYIDGKYESVTYISTKHHDLRVQTLYAGNKKESLATPIDEQASINTPKASSGTALDHSISQTSEENNPSAQLSMRSNETEQALEQVEEAKNALVR